MKKDAISWLRSREGLCWVPSPAGSAQETWRESQEPGLPGPVAPQRHPPSLDLDCRKPAGGNALPGGWERPGARRPRRFPGPRRAELSLRQTCLPRPPRALLVPSARWYIRKALQPDSWAVAAPRLSPTSAIAPAGGTEPTPPGQGRGGVQPSLLGGETPRPEGLSVSGPRS